MRSCALRTVIFFKTGAPSGFAWAVHYLFSPVLALQPSSLPAAIPGFEAITLFAVSDGCLPVLSSGLKPWARRNSIVLAFLTERWDQILALTLEHAALVLVAMVLAALIGVTVGIFISTRERLAQGVLYAAGVVMTIPSLALFALMIPLFGLGWLPALVGLVLYAQLPILRNTCTGLQEVDPKILEAARAMGMTEQRILTRVKLPLALPVIMAGVRTSVVMGVGIASVAAYIGSGGLGELIFRGISRTQQPMILAGALMIAVLALACDAALARLERRSSWRKTQPTGGDVV